MNIELLKAYWTWILRGAVLLAIGLLVFVWNHEHKTRLQLTQDLEKERLKAHGLFVESQEKQKTLDQQAQELLKTLADQKELQAQIDVLKKSGAEPRIVEVVKWRTPEAHGSGDPLPQGPAPLPGSDGKCPEPPACLFAPSSTGHIEVGELTFETNSKNRVLLGEADFIRDSPTKSTIYHAAIETKLSQASMEKLSFSYRWGVGGLLVAAKDGWALGPKVLFPPFTFFGLQGEADAGFGLGPNGQFAGVVSAGLRWR